MASRIFLSVALWDILASNMVKGRDQLTKAKDGRDVRIGRADVARFVELCFAPVATKEL